MGGRGTFAAGVSVAYSIYIRDGNPHDFIDIVYSGQDIPFSFHGKKFWLQGYDKDSGCHMEEMECFAPYNYLWECDDADYQKCGDAFQEALIFDGKSFWEADIESANIGQRKTH